MTSEQSDHAGRLRALEDRVTALESVAAGTTSPVPTSDSAPGAAGGTGHRATFWALDGLREHLEEPGGVLFTGTVDLPTGEHLEWQQQAGTDGLLESDWSVAATSLAALSHPVRLVILREVLRGTRTTADLAGLEPLGTAGQLHHHLRPLVAAGWLRTTGRGRYEVPSTRVVPLLVALTAAGMP